MARDFEPSASQRRAINLFGLSFDGTHAGAKAVLSAAGLTENGIPNGLTPAKAKKLGDDELRAAFGVVVVDAAAVSAQGAAAVQAIRDERATTTDRINAAFQARRDAMNAYAAARKAGEIAPYHSDEDVREEMAQVAEIRAHGIDLGEPARDDY
jgi:TRAP-type uncharacterized transport system substrate-binding protein